MLHHDRFREVLVPVISVNKQEKIYFTGIYQRSTPVDDETTKNCFSGLRRRLNVIDGYNNKSIG